MKSKLLGSNNKINTCTIGKDYTILLNRWWYGCDLMTKTIHHNYPGGGFINLFCPKFMKWTFPLMHLDMSIIVNRDISRKIKIECQRV